MRAADSLKILAVVKALWGSRFTIDPQAEYVWGAVLEGEEPEACVQAAVQHMKDGAKFPPTPGELRQLVRGADPEAAFTPEAAWLDALTAIQMHEEDGKPPFASCPIIQKTMDLFPDSEWAEENQRFLRPQFLTFYRSFLKGEQRRLFAKHLNLTSGTDWKQLGGGA